MTGRAGQAELILVLLTRGRVDAALQPGEPDGQPIRVIGQARSPVEFGGIRRGLRIAMIAILGRLAVKAL